MAGYDKSLGGVHPVFASFMLIRAKTSLKLRWRFIEIFNFYYFMNIILLTNFGQRI